MRGPSYLALTSSISWLLMPWLLASPGHQQPWYWLCKIISPGLIRGRISIIFGMSVWRNDIKYKYVYVSSEKVSTLRVLSFLWNCIKMQWLSNRVSCTAVSVNEDITMTSHECLDISNDQQLNCFIKSTFRPTAKKISMLHFTGSWWGQSMSNFDWWIIRKNFHNIIITYAT